MEEAAARFPQRKAYEDETCSMTFSEARRLAASIGTGIAALENPGRPVAVFMEKSVWMAVSLLGVSCGGCIYCPVDVAMPEARMDRILSALEPAAVLTSGSMGARAREACGDCPVTSCGGSGRPSGRRGPSGLPAGPYQVLRSPLHPFYQRLHWYAQRCCGHPPDGA